MSCEPCRCSTCLHRRQRGWVPEGSACDGLSECARLRAELASAGPVVEAARTYVALRLEAEFLDNAAESAALDQLAARVRALDSTTEDR